MPQCTADQTSFGRLGRQVIEANLDLFETLVSGQKFLGKWLRILFSALAYTLMQRLRELALVGTELAQATAASIHLRLLKIGARETRNTRRTRILLASHHPLRNLFLTAARALDVS